MIRIWRVKGNDKGNVFKEQNKWKHGNINSRRAHINLKTSDDSKHEWEKYFIQMAKTQLKTSFMCSLWDYILSKGWKWE